MGEQCGIPHAFCSPGPNGVCIRPAGHDGLCWTRWERTGGGAIRRAEWWSKDGKFWRHHQYRAWYPTNAARRGAD